MRLEDYVRVLWKRWWLIGLVGLTAAVAAYVFSKTQEPEYRSQARYAIGINRPDSGAIMFADTTLRGYILRVNNLDQMQLVVNQLQLDVSAPELMQGVRFQARPSESEVIIEVDYKDQSKVQQIATVIGQRLNAVAVEANRTYTGEDRITLDPAGSASAPYLARPRTRINVLAGAILGLILGVLLAYVLEYLDDTLKSAADVERYTQLITIGAIPTGAAQGGRGRPRLRAAPASGIIAQPAQASESRHDH